MADDRPRIYDPEAKARSRALLIGILRVLMFVLIAAVTLLTVLQDAESPVEQLLVTYWPAAILFAAVLYASTVFLDKFTPVKRISLIGGVFLGLLAGMLAAVALGFVIDLLVETYDLRGERIVTMVKVSIGIVLCYLGMSVVLQTQDDFRLIIPYVEFAKQMRGVRPMIMDSSALIDGRILDISETGMLQAPIIVPRFVIAELQLLSDSSDKMKRARGRRGLDLVTKLQRSARLDVSVDDWPTAGKGVDATLVEQAQAMNAVLVTTDTGLARVARIHSVPVLNINDLANALKPNVIPGEALHLRVMKAGEQPGQGVGYLDDGTMIVVEDGGRSIGQDVVITVTSSMQTSAGRLIFGRIGGEPSARDKASALATQPPEAAGVGEAHAQTDPLTHTRGAHDEEAEPADEADGPLGPFTRAGDARRSSRRNPRRG